MATLSKKGTLWFFGLFIIVGLGLTLFSFILPCAHLITAKQWVKADCTILNSQAMRKVSKNSTERSVFITVDVMYEYTFNGLKHQNNQYGFFDKLSRLSYKNAQTIASRYKEGSAAACFVNPAKPSEAVLQRNFEAQNLLGLVPLIFSAAGVIGFRQIHKSKQFSALINQQGSIELKPQSRVIKAIVWFLVSLVCCTSAFFLWHEAPVFMSIIFAIFGLLLMWLSICMFLAIFNPTVRLQLIPAVVEVNNAGVVTWEMQGRVERLQKLTLSLQCRQRTQDNDKSKTNIIYNEELITHANMPDIIKGQIGFVIGPEQIATRQGSNENVRWYLVVKGDIKHWPDIEDEFEFRVIKS